MRTGAAVNIVTSLFCIQIVIISKFYFFHYHSGMDEKENFCEFFEGTEKLLEIWFESKSENNPSECDLRAIPR